MEIDNNFSLAYEMKVIIELDVVGERNRIKMKQDINYRE